MSPAELDDRSAVQAYLGRGDEAAFDALYRRHAGKLYGLALRLTGGDEAEAAEVVQEAWVRALGGLGGFRWDASLSTWLCSVVVNVWREHRRQAGRWLDWDGSLEETCPPPDPRPGLVLDVTRALDELAPGYRTVLVLYGLYGYSHDEIAGLLGISVGTSKSQLSRARAALRKALER